jgi:hypothetical protein
MKLTRIRKLTVSGTVLIASVGLLLTSCKITHTEDAGTKPGITVAANDTGKGGAQLWAENCVRCHNNRSPSTYSDGEWDVAMHHMRIRANLTAEEHRKILQFLKSAN